MSAVHKRSETIRGHRTSYSLEEPFQRELEEIAARRSTPLAMLVAEVDETRPRTTNLSSALRLYVLDAVRKG